MTFRPRIAIVGGGPAGLTLGLLLHKHRIPSTIFELRQKPTEEELARPSGMLDLHQESGLAAIKECGLIDDFLPLTGECTEDFKVAERNGNILYTVRGKGTRPEISRNNLTKLLLGNIPTGSVKWDHRLLSATRSTTSDNETELEFGTHGKHTFDLVIGADGAWSKVRRLLTDVKPHYTGTQNITITIKGITEKYPRLAKLVGSGSFSSLGNKHVVVSQRGPIDSSRIYLWLTISDENFATDSGLAGKLATSAKDKLLKDDALLGTFGASMKELVATACDEESADNPGASLDIKALYMLPHGTSWEHRGGVTLVGDAAHLMLPNGEGVNLAMFDSLLLSQAVIKAYKTAGKGANSFQTTFDPLLKEFEDALVERAKETGNDTDGLIGKMFGTDDAAYDFANFLQNMAHLQPDQ
ncbi:salicylate hydroxylase [Xylariales sp. AK1849]|nr:salicylate hydroxylase [Xylariales sp. AK1849]